MSPDTFEALVDARAKKRAAVLATNLSSAASELLYPLESRDNSLLMNEARAALAADRPRLLATAEGDVFLNVFNPPLRMIIVGAVHIAQPLAAMASLAGYAVSVVDPRTAFATDARFPGVELSHAWPDEAMAALAPDTRTAVVTLTHDPKLDDPALDAALKSPAFYIAALGSRKTHASRLERLAARGHAPDTLARIHGPAGLAIGAQSPAEIALSVMAQATAALRQAGHP